ncbi:pyridoxamine 5'-phosphate oxidase family protein [Pseudooceanicola sediminis]|uniref:Pyridoxamine 5'-phosphate oxidase family protein n=1 Tax=Pseudooceanicola sediminis TaxID=2211117 RepID=A0A399J396_9RHOB|nr:pyridoxamine 5'-phosphate oxidase family protein [Pseudooceanicola sediminis]KAA2316194.1 pyridoxamine 5'-phosphate oxidase family protein [Puniceibacterium sp. HSS470]RII39107.1 pyridoxamine 5'-phosphate oxidase family protein [Pseudooceanicola sediminis]|tara:strand:- start:70092 stop:70655 length:564 start_codon:yes stop_codon:yes gene_type:complete
MAKQFDQIEDAHQRFIEEQHMFFTGTAAPDGYVNVSPKGMDSLRVLGPNRIIWRNMTGSGNETAGHLAQSNRMTLMWCSFTTRPMILRCYGTARTIHRLDPDWSALDAHFVPAFQARQIYDLTVTLVQTSCGYAVPFMDFVSDRDTLDKWAQSRGQDQVRDYWRDRNTLTMDGAPTGIVAGNLGPDA